MILNRVEREPRDSRAAPQRRAGCIRGLLLACATMAGGCAATGPAAREGATEAPRSSANVQSSSGAIGTQACDCGRSAGSPSSATQSPASDSSAAPMRVVHGERGTLPPAAPGGGTKPFLFTAGELTEEPTRDELRTLDLSRRRTISAKVRVEGYTDLPAYRIVPDYSEEELSEEQKQILGVKPEYDELKAFYHMPRGTEHGVSPIDSWIAASVGGVGGARVSVRGLRQNAKVGLDSIIDSHVSSVSSHVARGYGKPSKVAVAGIPFGVRVGSGPERSRATRAERDD